VQHVKPGAGEGVDRGLIDRARAQRAAEHQHAGLVGPDLKPRPGRGAVGGRCRYRTPGDQVLVARPPVKRERQADPVGQRGEQTVGQTEMAV
jgi:hypothetical protein